MKPAIDWQNPKNQSTFYRKRHEEMLKYQRAVEHTRVSKAGRLKTEQEARDG